ncbi:hypothetical protein C8Q72DRAFT_798489 [Fomitopsis betulina]|nr:hypothetical protein C8Q72DRAFT_798489 [Fomitopsis betulina]
MAPLPLPLPAVTNANLTCDEDGFIILLDVVSNDYHQFPVTAFCEFIRYDSIICKFSFINITTRGVTIVGEGLQPRHLDHYAPLPPPFIIEHPAKESGAEARLHEALIKDAASRFIKGVEFRNKSHDRKEEKREEALRVQKAREAAKNSHSRRDDHTEPEVFREDGLAMEGNLGNLFDLDLAPFPPFDQELEFAPQDEQGDTDTEGEEMEVENMDTQL